MTSQPTVCDIVPEGILSERDRRLALRAMTLARAWTLLGAKKLKAKTLSKYDLRTLSPFSNFNVVFGDILLKV